MAQKRMFDKSIIETDDFADLPMSAKALYFLLGMEADDEGFVSPQRVIRAYGGTVDDLKILIVKRYCIQFKSGVVVLTHFKQNNWLDSRRITQTRYVEEKKLLEITSNKEYVLKEPCLADAKPLLSENRIEENRIEEEEEKAAPEKKINSLSLTKGQVTSFTKAFPGLSYEDIKEEAKKCNEYMAMSSSSYTNPGLFFRGWMRKVHAEWKKKKAQEERDRVFEATHQPLSEEQLEKNRQKLAELRSKFPVKTI